MQTMNDDIVEHAEPARRRASCLVLGVTLLAVLGLCSAISFCAIFGYNVLPVILLPYGQNNIHLSRPTSDATIYIYNGHRAAVNTVTWEPDGKRVASADDNGTVHIWDAAGGGGVSIFSGLGGSIRTLAWSPDGANIAVGYSTGIVQVWDPSNGQSRYTFQGHASSVELVAWSPDGQRLASLDNQTNNMSVVHIWDALTGNNLVTIKGETTLAWAPDGKRIATYDDLNTVTVWDSTKGNALKSYTLANTGSFSAATLVWSQNGQHLFLASMNNQHLQVWSVDTGERILSQASHKNIVEAIAWSPDVRRIATASQDETVNIWDAQTGQLLYTYPCYVGIVTSVVWSPNGTRLVSGSGSEIPTLGNVKDDTVQVWRAP